MLRLLTDEHISPVVAEQVQAKRPEMSIQSVHPWRDGFFMGKADALLLRTAQEEGLTLLTYDQKTLPPLLMELASAEASHSGVVFVDEETISSNDFGSLVRSIILFYDRGQEWEWENRLSFLDAASAHSSC